MITAENDNNNKKTSFSVTVTASRVITPDAIFGFDAFKAALEHFDDFYSHGSTGMLLVDRTTSEPVKKVASDEDLAFADQYNLAFRCGVDNGLVVLNIGANRGSFVPKLKLGRYGVEHTSLGNLVTKTKRIIPGSGNINLIFGINRDDWPDGLNSCMLVQPDLEGHGPINLLANNSYQLIEPSFNPATDRAYRFYTPLYHIEGAGNAFRDSSATYPLYRLGIMTLNRTQLSELLRAFNKDWSNGPVFARKHAIGEQFTDVASPKNGRRGRKQKEGLDKRC